MLLSILTAAAAAAPLSYQQALDEALQANTSVLGAEADRSSAEGALLSTRGAWDPQLTGSIFRTTDLSQGRFQGLAYDANTQNTGWATGLGQTLATGTSWGLDYTGSRNKQLIVYPDSFGGQDVQLDVDAFSSNLTASLTQQVLKGWKMSYNLQSVDAARRSLTSAEAALLQTRQTVLASTARAYWDLYAARRRLQVAERAVRVAEEERRIVDAQVAAGNLAPIEQTRVASALAGAQLSRIQAEIAVGAATDALAILLGRDPGEPIEPQTPPGPVQAGLNISLDGATEAALAGNPGLLIQRVALESAEINLANARHGRLPTLSVTGRFGLNGYVDEDNPTYADAAAEMMSFDLQTRYLGANLSTPLGNRAQRGQVDSAAAGVERARLDLQAAEREVMRQAAELLRTIANASQQVTLAELNLELAEQTLDAEKARQAVGRAIQKDILEAQRQRDDAESGLIAARVAYRKALVDLQALQGKL